MIAILVSSGLETLLNGLLRQDPQAQTFLEPLVDKTIALHLTDIALSLYLLAHRQGIQVQSSFSGNADVTLRGKASAFAKMHFDANQADALFKGAIQIEGDLEVAKQLQNLFRHIEFDWEEWISRISGDVVARQFSNLIKTISTQARNNIETMQMDISEYLQEEKQRLVPAFELRDLLDRIDETRMDTDRMEARIARLTSLLSDQKTGLTR